MIPSRSHLPETLRWTRTSYFMLSAFLAVIGLIIAVWWPLAKDYLEQVNPAYPLWAQIDWLLIGIFLAMSILIMMGADIRIDA
jgi:cell division protein FtsW (lipid II flippase)